MENLLNNTHALLATTIAIVGGIGCIINLVQKKKRKAKALLQHLGANDRGVDKRTYQYLTSKNLQQIYPERQPGESSCLSD